MSQEERAGQEPALKVTSVQTPACPRLAPAPTHKHNGAGAVDTALALRHRGRHDLPPSFNQRQSKGRFVFFYRSQKVKFLPLRHRTSEKTNWALKIAGAAAHAPCELKDASGKWFLYATRWFPSASFPDMNTKNKIKGRRTPVGVFSYWGGWLPFSLYQWVKPFGRCISMLFTN